MNRQLAITQSRWRLSLTTSHDHQPKSSPRECRWVPSWWEIAPPSPRGPRTPRRSDGERKGKCAGCVVHRAVSSARSARRSPAILNVTLGQDEAGRVRCKGVDGCPSLSSWLIVLMAVERCAGVSSTRQTESEWMGDRFAIIISLLQSPSSMNKQWEVTRRIFRLVYISWVDGKLLFLLKLCLYWAGSGDCYRYVAVFITRYTRGAVSLTTETQQVT